MAKDSDKGKKARGASKKSKEEPRNWAKIVIPLLLVFIMVGSIFAIMVTGNWSNIAGNSGSNTKIEFGSIADGLRLIPEDAGFARYVDLKNDTVLGNATESYTWLKGSLPPSSIFNANPQRDLFAIYPARYFSSYNSQFVSLTDFGTTRINKSWPDSTGSDYSHNLLSNLNIVPKEVNSNYYYTPSTVPVISGMLDNIAPVAYVMLTGNTSLSSYGQYADLFDELKYKQIPIGGMTFETVGTSCNLTTSDRYYAAIGPVDASNKSQERLYSYVIIVHVNSTITDQDRRDLALLEGAMEKMGFQSYRTQVYDDYIVIEAVGTMGLCLDDMYSRWGFIKYQASL